MACDTVAESDRYDASQAVQFGSHVTGVPATQSKRENYLRETNSSEGELTDLSEILAPVV
jgi:hypothetical protein